MGTHVAHVRGTMDHPFLYSPAVARARSALRLQIPSALIACALACAGLIACDPKSDAPDAAASDDDYYPPDEQAPRPDAGKPVIVDEDEDAGADEEPQPPPDEHEVTLSALPGRGAAVAIAQDDSLAVVVNRDQGSVSVLKLGGEEPSLTLVAELAVGEGSEPWQVAIDPAVEYAYVVLRNDQKLVRIGGLKGMPELAGTVALGSEPTAVALSPTGAYAYVANWNEGTVDEIDTAKMKVLRSFDLNAALVETGLLGEVSSRPALAHPRSLVVSNDLDADDGDESLYVTEFFGQQVEAELADGSNADTRKVGLVYSVALSDASVKTIKLGALGDIGFKDDKGQAAGCYPNQLQAIGLNGPFAYVVSVCASPEGPLGAKVTTTACTAVADCSALNLVEPVCALPFAGAASSVCVDVASVKTTTAPVLSVIDTRTGHEVPDSATNLNASFAALYQTSGTAVGAQRFPLFANDIAFVPGTTVAYLTASGSDAAFRVELDADTGRVHAVGSSTQLFINLAPTGKSPVGMAIGHLNKKRALVANEVTRNASLIDFNTQSVALQGMDPVLAQTSSLPAAGSDEDDILQGKRFFNTGLARWSLRGQGWGACQSCHGDGLTDNVTWYFPRGPRQSISLDGSFASNDHGDQRIFNWTAIFDEVDDFELNTRGVSGGVGAIVSALSAPPSTGDRIDIAGLGHAGLNGSAAKASDPSNPLGFDAPPQLRDWEQIKRYMQTLRSPRAPVGLDPDAVEKGRELFAEYGACAGCHSGAKWTVSTLFYDPNIATNAQLFTTPFTIPAGFPSALLPAKVPANQTLRFAGGNAAAFDQIMCAVRPVGTFNVAEPGVGIAELRVDMTTLAQGDGNPQGEGAGFNPPSLLGLGTGAPYLHAGNARTLEALLASTFETHHRSLAPNFLAETDPKVVQRQVDQLVQFLLSIDETTEAPAIPAPGAAGGQLCPTSFTAAP